jgi:hypothetical protein
MGLQERCVVRKLSIHANKIAVVAQFMIICRGSSVVVQSTTTPLIINAVIMLISFPVRNLVRSINFLLHTINFSVTQL